MAVGLPHMLWNMPASMLPLESVTSSVVTVPCAASTSGSHAPQIGFSRACISSRMNVMESADHSIGTSSIICHSWRRVVWKPTLPAPTSATAPNAAAKRRSSGRAERGPCSARPTAPTSKMATELAVSNR